MKRLTYSEKLKDPRWQRKRLQIFNRDDWKCVVTGLSTQTLCVHHMRYHGAPWSSPDDELETVCETVHELITPIARYLQKSAPEVPFSARELFPAVAKAIDDETATTPLELEFQTLKNLRDNLKKESSHSVSD